MDELMLEPIGPFILLRDKDGRRFDSDGNRVYFNKLITGEKHFAVSYDPPALVNGERIPDHLGYIPQDAELFKG